MDDVALTKIVEFLQNVPFFSEVERPSLEQLVEDVSIEEFFANEVVIEKGEIGEAMYVILDGAVKVHDHNHLYGHFSTSDCFGEYALIDEKPRSASVTTTQNSKVLRIDRSKFSNLMANDRGFAQGILSVLIKRHRELDTIQERLATSKQELELANAKMFGLIDGAMDSILMFDENFRIILANPAAKAVLENEDVLQRNVLFFLDEPSATLMESLVSSETSGVEEKMSKFIKEPIKIIGSMGAETLHEGTISGIGGQERLFYTLILRNIENRLKAESTIELLTNQAKYLEAEINELTNSYGIIGEDRSMKKVLASIKQVAATDATVLILGETGTGKELVARAVHQASDRCDCPLIRINCGAIPSSLIESELFGHEKGAFTGATSSRKGRFLLADKGTIFLDEIGELPLELQPKLLRVIQEGEFEPIGSAVTIKVDVRIVAATHRDLQKKSSAGEFREDLYYRLNVFPITVPPLRKRGNDVCLIADAMIAHFSKKMNRVVPFLDDDQKALFRTYHWPGNVRELQNLIERAVIVSKNGTIDWDSIIPVSNEVAEEAVQDSNERVMTADQMLAMEKENILRALKQTNWKISGSNGAASLLNLPPTTLSSKIKALGLSRPV